MTRVTTALSFRDAVWVGSPYIPKKSTALAAQKSLAYLTQPMENRPTLVLEKRVVAALCLATISAAAISGIILFPVSPLIHGILVVTAAVSSILGISILILDPWRITLNSASDIETYKTALKKGEFSSTIQSDAIKVMPTRKEAMDQMALDTPRQLQLYINGAKQGKGREGARKTSALLSKLIKDPNCEQRILSALHQGIAAPTTLFTFECFQNPMLNCYAFEDRATHPFRIDVEIQSKNSWRLRVATGWNIAQISSEGHKVFLGRYQALHTIDGPSGHGHIHLQKI